MDDFLFEIGEEVQVIATVDKLRDVYLDVPEVAGALGIVKGHYKRWDTPNLYTVVLTTGVPNASFVFREFMLAPSTPKELKPQPKRAFLSIFK